MGSNHEHGQHPAWVMISIHAPRMGSDNPACWSLGWRWIFQSTLPGWGATWTGPRPKPPDYYFNPRSPDGERPSPPGISPKPERFQSTLPGWGATVEIRTILTQIRYFNPRSPDGERPERISMSAISRDFNPRSPDGERRGLWPDADGSGGISIHAPRMGSDRLAQIRAGAPVGISIHAPRMGSDGPLTDTYSGVSSFQSTLPGWGATT